MLRTGALSAVLGATLVAFAQAQPASVFGEAPPRPPANIPGGMLPPQPPPQQFQGQPPQPSGPPPSAIQAQPLPPPPGSAAATAQPGAPRARMIVTPNGPIQPGAAPPGGAQPGANPPQPADTAPPPDDTIVTEMPTQKIENTRAVFAGLDKITGRIISFDSAIGETVQFGALRVTARVCYTRPPTEATNTDAFVEVDEVTLQGEIKRIFSGWMFAASPGLHAIEHPIYDIWLTDCAGPARVAEPAVQPTPAVATPNPRPPRPRQPASARAQQPPPAPQPVAPPLQPR